jgi:hypothetical protein
MGRRPRQDAYGERGIHWFLKMFLSLYGVRQRRDFSPIMPLLDRKRSSRRDALIAEAWVQAICWSRIMGHFADSYFKALRFIG